MNNTFFLAFHNTGCFLIVNPLISHNKSYTVTQCPEYDFDFFLQCCTTSKNSTKIYVEEDIWRNVHEKMVGVTLKHNFKKNLKSSNIFSDLLFLSKNFLKMFLKSFHRPT